MTTIAWVVEQSLQQDERFRHLTVLGIEAQKMARKQLNCCGSCGYCRSARFDQCKYGYERKWV